MKKYTVLAIVVLGTGLFSARLFAADVSTYIIENQNGGDCSEIGAWSNAEKTCTLSGDVSGRIVIRRGNGITFDGSGYTLTSTGKGSGAGVQVEGGFGNTVKNLSVQQARYGLRLIGADDSVLLNNTASESKVGINVGVSPGVLIEGNTVTGSELGMTLGRSENLVIKGNRFYKNEQGVKFSLHNDYSGNVIDRTNTINGKPIVYKEFAEDENFDLSDTAAFYCYKCENVEAHHLEAKKAGYGAVFFRAKESTIRDSVMIDNAYGIMFRGFGENTVKGNVLRDNDSGILVPRVGKLTVYQNTFRGNDSNLRGAIENQIFSKPLPEGGNYWEAYDEPSEGCEDGDGDGFCDEPYEIPFAAWTTKDMHPRVEPAEGCVTDCYSNVAFLPGIQASRLYRKDEDGDEDQLWEPTREQDVEQLFMDENGESIDLEIYTKDIIDESPRVINGYNIYKKFSLFMDDISGEGGIINEWKPLSYDWRLSLSKILETGVYDNGEIFYRRESDEPYIISELRKLAKNSKTGKVTIVAHSNGGLLAKLLLAKLEAENDPLYEKIDKLVLVASPQLGTPKAIASLLHGDEQTIGPFGAIVGKSVARTFGENVIPGYGLLPSKEYFQIVDTPVFYFDNEVGEIAELSDLAGTNISSYAPYKDFLLGHGGAWEEPANDDTDTPNVLDERFITQSEKMHTRIANWRPAESMEVVQIVGWGLDTISGIEYDNCDILFCPDTLNHLDRGLEWDVAGDGTVLAPSAMAMKEANTYFIELGEYNSRKLVNRGHPDILEVSGVQNFIRNILKGNRDLPKNILLEHPTGESRLRFSMHSPVVVDLYDEGGRHTGLAPNPDQNGFRLYEEEIPNSYYLEFGEGKYLGSSSEGKITVVLDGLDYGTFTFEITEVEGNEETQTIMYKDVPVTPETQAHIELSSLEDRSALEIDIDGDGEKDFSLEDGADTFDPLTYLSFIQESLKTMNFHRGVKRSTEAHLQNLERELKRIYSGEKHSKRAHSEKGKKKEARKEKHERRKFEKAKRIIERLIENIDRFKHQGKISSNEANVLIKQLKSLKSLMVE